MKSSIQDVAQLAHVSISTVSRSFTRPDLVSKATRDKVMKAADELNFSISRSAAALKTGRALRIAVLISGRLNLWFSSSIMEGLNESFHDEGYDISIYQMSSAEERRTFFDMLPVRRNVDAVIVISFDIDSNEIRQLSQSMCQSSASIRACRKSAASTPPCASMTSRDPNWPHAT